MLKRTAISTLQLPVPKGRHGGYTLGIEFSLPESFSWYDFVFVVV